MKINKTIYIVDDDEDDRMLLREAINDVIEHSMVREASSGVELIDQIRLLGAVEDTVILMDMNMPKMNGLEALTIIREDQDLRHIPVIMVSTTSNPELIKKAYSGGINAFIVKPCMLNEYTELARAVDMCFLRNYPPYDRSVAINNSKTKNILVIEDRPDQSKLINLALKHSIPNVNVINILDQAHPVEFISSHWQSWTTCPQLILLDLYLPNRSSGLALLELIKQFLASKNLMAIPIIMLSQSDDPEDIKDCYRGQANAYMTKSSDLTVWLSFFSYLCHFWMNTIVTQNNLLRN